jgi:hypothetical protein
MNCLNSSHPSRPAPSRSSHSALLLAGCLFLAGCSAGEFYANYYIDPKPPRLTYSDLKPPHDPKPVYLVFDMYASGSAFTEATRKLAPKIARTVEGSHLFSTVSKVGSENMARIQVSMRETAVLAGKDTRTLPEGLTSGLKGSKGAIVYQFTTTYQAPGQEAVKKIYPHAVHVVEGSSPQLADVFPLTASHAVDVMVEQVMLHFLRDLQREGKL